MADWYAILGEQLSSRKMAKAAQTLQRISRQPGFSGVRQQSWALIQFARSRGYAGEVPFLYFFAEGFARGATCDFLVGFLRLFGAGVLGCQTQSSLSSG